MSVINGKLMAQMRHGACLRFLAKVIFNLRPKREVSLTLSLYSK